ncbi:MAG: alanine racemase [Gammaproteobacteria bacterium]
MTPAAVAIVRPAALQSNLARVRELAPGCPVLAVIKANAYGHGLVEVAQILEHADAFAVARIEEAAQLRAAGIEKRLLIFSGCLTSDELQCAGDLNLDIVVHSVEQLALLESARLAPPLACWLKVDSGMSRLGITPAEVPEALGRLRAAGSVRSIVLMTHLASADDLSDQQTMEQLQRFAELLVGWDGDLSIANSAAILQWPDAVRSGVSMRYSGRNWVRPGLMLFGASPLRGKSASQLGLVPAMSFETRLIAVKRVKRGQRVGYGGHWVAPQETVLGVVAAGYADGYPWHAGAGTTVSVRNQRAPVVGRVSMDMLTIDLTEIQGARAGDSVVLWGDGPSVEEVAAAARTIPWALMTGINRRVAVRLERSPS